MCFIEGFCSFPPALAWRRPWTFVYIAIGFSFLNILLLILLNYDERLTQDAKSYKSIEKSSETCNLLDDPLAISALSRMKSPECKFMLRQLLCSMEAKKHWPVTEVNNTCGEYFDPTIRQQKLGCFKDPVSDRLLQDFRYNFSISNSPELCVQNCLHAGFALAGVEFGVECFCASSSLSGQDLAERSIADSLCEEYKCPGNGNAFCGGFEAIQLYRTGVKGKFNQQFPEFQSIDEGDAPAKNNNIRILFLFQLNGRNAHQIRRLLRMIYSQKHLYLVHVDSRQQFLQSEMLKIERQLATKNMHNFHVMRRRSATIWGGTSLLDLFLLAIAETIGSSQEFDKSWRQWDYLLNLSEADMPLLSLEELEHNLASANGASFLSSHGYNTGTFLHKQGFHYHFAECERRMWRVARRDNFPLNLRLDGGSDWVVVHRDLAQFAISRAPLPSQLRLLFQTILLPLESFFHTLALNSDQFCGRVLYRNLRFTNWRRKQGCRCSALKPVVDWCGCSPLALRGHEVETKLQNVHLKSQFFGRKFDSMVDQAPIAFVEQGRVLRFRPERIPDRQHPAFNATWLNLFHSTATGGAVNEEEDSDSPFAHKVDLLQAIARALLTSEGANEENTIAGQFLHSFGANCQVHRLLDVHVYKVDSNAKAQTLLSVEMECRQQQLVQIELLLDFVHEQRKTGEDKEEAIVLSDRFQFDGSRGIQFGLGFDVKEEIFRVHPPILDTASPGQTLTLKWHWNILAEQMEQDSEEKSANGTKTMGKSSSNNYNKLTSPAVELELRGPNVGNGEELPPLLLLNIDAYDSVWDNQHVQIRLDELGEEEAILAGIWTAALFLPANSDAPKRQRIKIAETSFPIFPSIRPTPFAPSPPNPSSSSSGSGISAAAAADAVGRIARRHFSLRDICVVLSSDDDGEAEEEITMMMTDYGLKECIETVWSSGFGADEKSEFPFPNFVQ